MLAEAQLGVLATQTSSFPCRTILLAKQPFWVGCRALSPAG